MAFRIDMGQYYPSHSLLHSLDPRAKLTCALVWMISVFFVTSPLQLVYALLCAAALVKASQVPNRAVIRSIKPLILILCVLSLFNLFFVQTGRVLISWGAIRITTCGLWDAICYPARFSVAILIGALVLLTTTPTELTDAFDALLSPLTRFHVPAHELAMVFSLMLRFIPTIADEARALMDAETARGAGFDNRSLRSRMKAIAPLIIALLVSSLRHAHNVARALDARAYTGGATRSHWHPLYMQTRDWGALATTLLYIVLLGLLTLI